jgi:hypothetical protein
LYYWSTSLSSQVGSISYTAGLLGSYLYQQISYILLFFCVNSLPFREKISWGYEMKYFTIFYCWSTSLLHFKCFIFSFKILVYIWWQQQFVGFLLPFLYLVWTRNISNGHRLAIDHLNNSGRSLSYMWISCFKSRC